MCGIADVLLSGDHEVSTYALAFECTPWVLALLALEGLLRTRPRARLIARTLALGTAGLACAAPGFLWGLRAEGLALALALFVESRRDPGTAASENGPCAAAAAGTPFARESPGGGSS
jgi:hypothetical protein